jgi:hypothetical protein
MLPRGIQGPALSRFRFRGLAESSQSPDRLKTKSMVWLRSFVPEPMRLAMANIFESLSWFSLLGQIIKRMVTSIEDEL